MTKSRRQRAKALDQLNLFRAPTRRPSWSAFAEDARATVTSLVARMLREQWVRESREQQEVEHE